jgi:hypothetical protein
MFEATSNTNRSQSNCQSDLDSSSAAPYDMMATNICEPIFFRICFGAVLID